jgi:hypothetical protein
MSQAHARPRADEDFLDGTPPALRAVPDDLTPEERRDWQWLSERRHRRERAEQADAYRRRPSAGSAGPSPRRGATPRPQSEPAPGVSSTAAPAAPTTAEAPAGASRQGLPVPRRTAPEPDHAAAPARRAVRADVAPALRKTRRRMPWAGIAAGPDRLALWAVVLCLFMALVAAATARGDEPAAAEAAASAAGPAGQPAAPQRLRTGG